MFTKEDQEGDVLPVLDLKQTVDRKIDQEDRMLCLLQEDSHKHKCKGKVQSPRKYEESDCERFY